MTGAWDALRIASAFIEEGQGSAKEWNGYARTIFAAALAEVFNRKGTNRDIVYMAALSTDEELKSLVGDQPAAAIFNKGSQKMLDNVKAIIGMALDSFKWLDPDAGIEDFSIRKWVRDEKNLGWIWTPYKDEFFLALKPLIATWCGLLSDSVLSLPKDENRRIFLFVDELGALPRISGLESALTRGRRYGLCVVGCLQSISQLRSIYQRDGAQTLLSNFGSWLILRAGDKETAEYMQDHLGKAQIIRTETSTTKSQGGESTSTSHRHADEVLVMYSEIMKFPDCHGVLTLAKGIPAAFVDLAIVQRDIVIDEWIPRDFSKAKKMPEMPVFSSQFEDI
jgi:type IV secretory pathway TraG/TraD family ATPase VirD4